MGCFRIRTLMLAVASCGLVFGGLRLWQLSREYERRAQQYETHHLLVEFDGNADLEARQRMTPAEWEAYTLRRYDEILQWRAQMEQKYRYAARHPWLSVAPDTPDPLNQ